MKKINILYIITKMELGGAQLQLLKLLKNLDREKFNIFLFTAREGPLVEDCLAIGDVQIKKSRFLERPINPLKDFLALFEMYCFIKKQDIAVVHTHSSKAGILGRTAARWAGIRMIFHTVHGWSFNDYQPRLIRWFYIMLERFSARFSTRLIVVSEVDKKRGLAQAIGSERQYQLIHYGIDFSLFEPGSAELKKEFNGDSSTLIVGDISCLKPQKAPQDFVRLALLIKQKIKGAKKIKFFLAGDGVLREEIEKFIQELGLQDDLILTGWRRDIPQFLAGTDVMVLTSLWEGLPICVLEAMAASVPVVATDTGGIQEVILEGHTGFLVKPHDMQEMCNKVLVLLNDEKLRIRIGSQARKFLDSTYTAEYMIARHEELYYNIT